MPARSLPLRAKVFHVRLEEPLEPLVSEPGYREIQLVVTRRGRYLGQVVLPFTTVLPPEAVRAAVARELGEGIWLAEARRAVRTAIAGEDGGFRQPAVSVVVCTRNRADQLGPCLDSLLALATPPDEVIVVDNAPSDASTRELCARYPVRYVREDLPGQSRARNRGIVEATGEVIAFTDDDCVVDPHWLDRLGASFADPLVMEVTGPVKALELETASQYRFERHGGFERGADRRVFDGAFTAAGRSAGAAGAGANMLFRRSVFPVVGLFAEDLGPGTPARAADDTDQTYRVLRAGYRVVFEPERLVWHRHRRDDRALRRVVFDYGASSFAFLARALGRYRDPSGLWLVLWWSRHLVRDLLHILRRKPGHLPLRHVALEVAGIIAGPVCLARSRRSRRKIPPVELPAAPAAVRRPPPRVVASELPRLSVVVPSHERRESLLRVLDALARQSLPGERFEVVAAIDGSTDGTAAAARALELPYRLEVVELEHAGVAAARNAGLARASGDVVVCLDDDTFPDVGCLAAHAAAHSRSAADRIGVGYCPPAVEGKGWFALELRSWWEDHYRRKGELGHQQTFVDFTVANASLPRGLLARHGGFDEAFTRRHEDWELGVRLLADGCRLEYLPEAYAEHHLDPTLATAARTQRVEAASDVQLVRKHPGAVAYLPLARYVARRPKAQPRLVRLGIAAAPVLERAGMRLTWQKVVRATLREAYLAGLHDAVPSGDEFLGVVAPYWRADGTLADLAPWSVGPLALPASGPAELAVEAGDGHPARVVAWPHSGQWDADGLVEDVLRAAGGRLLAGRVLASVGRPAEAAGDAGGAGGPRRAAVSGGD